MIRLFGESWIVFTISYQFGRIILRDENFKARTFKGNWWKRFLKDYEKILKKIVTPRFNIPTETGYLGFLFYKIYANISVSGNLNGNLEFRKLVKILFLKFVISNLKMIPAETEISWYLEFEGNLISWWLNWRCQRIRISES